MKLIWDFLFFILIKPIIILIEIIWYIICSVVYNFFIDIGTSILDWIIKLL